MRPPEGMDVRRVPEKDTPETAAFEVTLYGQMSAFREAARAAWEEILAAFLRRLGGPGRLGVREVECYPGAHEGLGAYRCPLCRAVR